MDSRLIFRFSFFSLLLTTNRYYIFRKPFSCCILEHKKDLQLSFVLYSLCFADTAFVYTDIFCGICGISFSVDCSFVCILEGLVVLVVLKVSNNYLHIHNLLVDLFVCLFVHSLLLLVSLLANTYRLGLFLYRLSSQHLFLVFYNHMSKRAGMFRCIQGWKH